MKNIMQKLINFMYGRYGFDKLSYFLFVLCFVVAVVNSFRGAYTLYAIELAIISLVFFRAFSRNIFKRQKESEAFERLLLRLRIYKLQKPLRNLHLRLIYLRTHRFRKCPNCKENLRLKRKTGSREIVCPKCGYQFKIFIIF